MTLLDSQMLEGLTVFLDRYGDTHAKLEILLFWTLHPNASFNKIAILSGVGFPEMEMEKALDDFVEGSLIECHHKNGLATYSLTTNEEIRQMVVYLGRLDWGQRRLLFSDNSMVNSAAEPAVR